MVNWFAVLVGLLISLVIIQPVAIVNPPVHLVSSILIFVAAGILAISISQ